MSSQNRSLYLSDWGRKLLRKLYKKKGPRPIEHDCRRWNIGEGDMVEVVHGKKTGQQGKVLQLYKKEMQVLVEGVNMVSFP